MWRQVQNKVSLEDHIKRHRNVFDYQCGECNEKFVSKETKNKHIKIRHIKSNLAMYL